MSEFNGQKILVVEDNFMSYKLIEAHFSRKNLGLVHASDGVSALRLFEKEKDIVLVLMDIQLPGMSGLEVTKAIREIDPQIPVIAATANVFDDDKIACFQAGCNEYISKPIDFPGLFRLLEKHLV